MSLWDGVMFAAGKAVFGLLVLTGFVAVGFLLYLVHRVELWWRGWKK